MTPADPREGASGDVSRPRGLVEDLGAVPVDPDNLAALAGRPPRHLADLTPAEREALGRALAQGVTAAVQALTTAVQGVVQALGPTLDPDPEPDRASDPAGYALWARRNRGTGPAVAPPGARRPSR